MSENSFYMSKYVTINQSINLLFYSTENMHRVLEIERRCIRNGRRPSSLIINALWYWNPTSSGEPVVDDDDDDDDVSKHTLFNVHDFIYLLSYLLISDGMIQLQASNIHTLLNEEWKTIFICHERAFHELDYKVDELSVALITWCPSEISDV